MALGPSDLKIVRKFLFQAREKWYDIGVELDIDPSILDSIQDRYSDPKDCLTEMIKEWLKSKPTWSALGDALKEEAVDEVELSEKGKVPVILVADSEGINSVLFSVLSMGMVPYS